MKSGQLECRCSKTSVSIGTEKWRGSSEGTSRAVWSRRLGEAFCLIDAATGENISRRDLLGTIVGSAVGFQSAVLRSGDPLLLGCSLSPASTLAYLGATCAGVVPMPVEERLLASSGNLLFAKPEAKAVWTAKAANYLWAKGSSVRHMQQASRPAPLNRFSPILYAENDLATLMPTSGFTSEPQLVTLSQATRLTGLEPAIGALLARRTSLRRGSLRA